MSQLPFQNPNIHEHPRKRKTTMYTYAQSTRPCSSGERKAYLTLCTLIGIIGIIDKSTPSFSSGKWEAYTLCTLLGPKPQNKQNYAFKFIQETENLLYSLYFNRYKATKLHVYFHPENGKQQN